MMRPMRILIVEDEPGIRSVLLEMLRRDSESFAVIDCPDGNSARQAIETKSFDLLIVDFSFPYSDGNEIARFFLSRNPGSKCIGMSGACLHKFEKGLFETTFLKPFPLADMKNKIREIRDSL